MERKQELNCLQPSDISPEVFMLSYNKIHELLQHFLASTDEAERAGLHISISNEFRSLNIPVANANPIMILEKLKQNIDTRRF